MEYICFCLFLVVIIFCIYFFFNIHALHKSLTNKHQTIITSINIIYIYYSTLYILERCLYVYALC